MRKNYSKFEEFYEGINSIWVKASQVPQYVMDTWWNYKPNLTLIDKGRWIEAIDENMPEFKIQFESNAISELLKDNCNYTCIIHDMEVIGQNVTVRLLIMKKEQPVATTSDQQLTDFHVSLPNTLKNLEFLRNEVTKKMEGYDQTPLYLGTSRLSELDPNIVTIYDAHSYEILGSMKCKELLSIIQKDGAQVGVFKEIEGKLSTKNIKAIISILRNTVTKKKSSNITRVKVSSSDNKDRQYKVVSVNEFDLFQTGPIDLESTSALVYIKFVDSNNEDQRVSIMNGNLQINVVGSEYVDGYEDFEEKIKTGDTITLIPEPTNPYDPDAIAAIWKGKQIGYVPKSRIPVVALCMNSSVGCKGIVYENKLGWIAFELKPTLHNLYNKDCIAKYGPFQFEVISNNQSVSLDLDQFLTYFKIANKKKRH